MGVCEVKVDGWVWVGERVVRGFWRDKERVYVN